MRSHFHAACLQLHSNENPEKNLEQIQRLAIQACKEGADFIFLPEHAPYLFTGALHTVKKMVLNWQHIALDFFINLSKEKSIWLCPTMSWVDHESTHLANRTYIIRHDGKIAAFYDKIHLFDAKLGGKEKYSESKIYRAGTKTVIASTPWGKMGMAICYDLRFPHLFQQLRKEGADYFCIPSSFSYLTGQAHWHALMRARAIENSCYVFAPNQYGNQKSGLTAYGHSLIISPWGEVLKDAQEGVGLIIEGIDKKEIKKARTLIPSSSFESPSRLKYLD